jgi:hypothetical protein
MVKHNLIALFTSLSENELKKLTLFVNSVYFNKRKSLVILFNQIMKFYPDFNSQFFTREYLCKQFTKHKTYNDSTLRDSLSLLLKLAEEFLAVESFRNNSLAKANILLTELNSRRLNKLFEMKSKHIESMSSGADSWDFEYYYNMYIYESCLYNHFKYGEAINKKDNVLKKLCRIGKSDKFLTLLFITEIVSDYVNLIISSKKYNIEIKNDFTIRLIELIAFDKIKKLFPVNSNEYIILKLYKGLYNTFSGMTKIKNYLSYKNDLIKYEEKLGREDLSLHYSRLISYCIIVKNCNFNLPDIEKELFLLYKKVIENKYYINKKVSYLPVSLFRAVFIHAIHSKNLEWARELIDKYINLINPADLKNNKNLYLAEFQLASGNYTDALEFITKVIPDNFINKYDCYLLMLQIKFLGGNYELVLNDIAKFSSFIKYDKFLSGDRKQNYKNFIFFLKKISLCKLDDNYIDINLYKHKIINTDKLSLKYWLLEQVQLIENIAA